MLGKRKTVSRKLAQGNLSYRLAVSNRDFNALILLRAWEDWFQYKIDVFNTLISISFNNWKKIDLGNKEFQDRRLDLHL